MRRLTCKILPFLAALLLCATSLYADSPTPAYERQARKAAAFFSAREWLNATAMYTLMLEEQPRDAGTYAHAIVARYFEADTVYAVSLIQRAMDHGVDFDRLLGDIKAASISAGSSDMYEDILLQARGAYPYLTRSINARLTDYYDFRSNAPELIRYSSRMLEGSPDNVRYRRLLARGYMLDDNPAEAARVWQGILKSDPDNLDTLVDLGCLYWLSGRRDDALPLLTRAYSLRPTPFLEALIERD